MAAEAKNQQELAVMTSNPKQSPAPAEDLDLDDDLFEDDLSGDPTGMTVWMRVAFAALFLVVAGMVVYLVLVILYPEKFAKPSWIGATQSSKEATTGQSKPGGFSLGGIELGMSPADVKAVYPNTRFEALPDGGVTGLFRHHDGEYQVWFHGRDQGERAYRIRSRHAYPKVSYGELLAELAGKYGPPDASNCGAEEGTIAIRCALQWALPDTALDTQIRTAAPPAGAPGGTPGGTAAMTTLTVTAVDLRTDAVFAKQAAHPSEARKSSTHKPSQQKAAKPAK